MELSNFTLLILQRDRQYNFKQLGQYYKDFNCKKIIFDSSVSKYDNISYLNECGFEYNYIGPMTYWEKLHLIHTSGKIDTEFVLDNPDDDITFKSSIIECVNFLSNNPDYNSCSGEHYYYNKDQIWLHSREKHLIALNHDKKFLNPEDRVHHYLNKYPLGMLHDVSRTSTMSSFYKMIGENEFLQRVNYIDRMYIVYSALVGNKKILPLGFQARHEDPPKRLIHSHTKAKMALKEHIKLDQNLDFDTLNPLSKKLSNIKDISVEESYKFLNSEFNYHFKVHRKDPLRPNMKNLDPNISPIHERYIDLTNENLTEFQHLISTL